MEEDGGAKAAPVTRLRRRPSVENDDTKSPSAPPTPTKKRSTRLAAKPQLELIDEHAVTDSPKKRTRKSISRDIIESEEKPVTPARRSARTKSNTSLVSEAEEKPLTPARRSTRIKSNTSIVAETAQSVESPRAKRAFARRNSQVGSDTEAPLTPARTRRARKISTSSTEEPPSVSEAAVTPGRTRRTRKGSTSSIDIPAEAGQAEKSSLVTEVITEEPEGKLGKSTSDTENLDSKDDSPTHKSPQLFAKKGRKSKSSGAIETPKQSQEHSENSPASTEKPDSYVNTTTEAVSQSDISMASANLIKDLDTKLKKKISNKNKSMSDIEYTRDSKKRDRTISWTTLCASPPVESNFYSDNESTKKKLKKHGKIFNDKRLRLADNDGSGDGPKPISAKQMDDEDKEASETNRKNKNESISNKSSNLENSIFEATKEVDISNDSNKENLGEVSKGSSTAELFETAPSADVKTMVFIEDSDSNTGSIGKQDKQINNEDQCVPVVLHQSEDKQVDSSISDHNNIFAINNMDNKVANEDSVEPMDIDETMPENVSLTVFTDKGKKPRKSSQNMPQDPESDGKDKSKRKSSESYSTSQILENSASGDQRKQARNLSLSVSQEPGDNFKVIPNKSKRLLQRSPLIILKKLEISRLSHSTSGDDNKEKNENIGIPVENHNVSQNKSVQGEKSRKSSLAQESESSLNKSKRKSILSNSISQDHKNESVLAESIKEVAMEYHESKTSRKSSMSMVQDDNDNCKESNKLKRKSSLSSSVANEKTGNESKSTLVLSQIKDISTAETSVSKSPENSNNLSKSINSEEPNKGAPVNKNLALSYLTSTPVQQKNNEKLAIQMNTSVITLITPTNIKVFKITHKKNMSMVSKSAKNNSSDEDSEESDEADESTQDKSDLFDNQAEDAGEDYESGDSRDEDDREYEKVHEIIDKGETLKSEDDLSNDSDYEKDSFIVSSDAEDNDLLSGSGDDLDMSDNELSLSVKSKKKYNDRKSKEQKKASREMFEARHGLSETNKVVKSKKSGRSRLDSTLLKSDEDNMPPKKNKRMRLESTLESSQAKSDSENAKSSKDISVVSDNDEIGYKKKKSKRLSESVCHESAINEKEITINQITTEKEDPLSVQIKTEPKTPLKDLEISRVHVSEDIEQVQIDENMSIIKFNDTSDPLQASTLQNDKSNDDDSFSENEEITNNYDSVLKELNDISLHLNKKDKQKVKEVVIDELNLTQTKLPKKDQAKEKSVNESVLRELNSETKKQIKTQDISLNLNKKNKKPKEAIVDELNLTQTKISKKDRSFQAKEKSVKRVFKKLAGSDESSDSIDLKLLFSDASNGSDKGGDDKRQQSEGAKEVFIPLKRTEAETDIRESRDGDANEGELLTFFIDTKGDLSDRASNGNESDEAPVEVLYVSNKEKINSTLTKTPTAEKKKEGSDSQSPEADVSVSETPASSKKRNPLSLETTDQISKIPTSKKKKENKSSELHDARQENIAHEQVVVTDEDNASTHKKKRKRKPSLNKSADDVESGGNAKVLNSSQQTNESTVLGNKKKKLKISTSLEDNNIQTPVTEAEKPEKDQTNLKKKKIKHLGNEQSTVDCDPNTKVTKKRKIRDEEDDKKQIKVFKGHSFDKVHVPRLPSNVIDQLRDMPRQEINEKRRAKVVSTSNFIVEETQKRKNKPSDFSEESVYLNEEYTDDAIQEKTHLQKPKVLPFLPTVSISDSGFTTNFQVNVISQKMEFVARNNDIPNFKNDYLSNKRIKKLRTYDIYKKQRSVKLNKY